MFRAEGAGGKDEVQPGQGLVRAEPGPLDEPRGNEGYRTPGPAWTDDHDTAFTVADVEELLHLCGEGGGLE